MDQQTQSNDIRILSIEGNIGTGKTTFLRELVQQYEHDPSAANPVKNIKAMQARGDFAGPFEI